MGSHTSYLLWILLQPPPICSSGTFWAWGAFRVVSNLHRLVSGNGQLRPSFLCMKSGLLISNMHHFRLNFLFSYFTAQSLSHAIFSCSSAWSALLFTTLKNLVSSSVQVCQWSICNHFYKALFINELINSYVELHRPQHKAFWTSLPWENWLFLPSVTYLLNNYLLLQGPPLLSLAA